MAEKKKSEKDTNESDNKHTSDEEKHRSEKEAMQVEQRIAREQRQELKDELTENFAQRPRMPRNRQRVITFSILGVIALLAALFLIFVLLPAAPQTPHGGIVVGEKAPDFSLPVQGGLGRGNIALEGLRGHPVVLNFWSVTCPPCNAEVPYLRGLYTHYSATNAFILLGVDQADPSEDIQSFGQRFQVNYSLLFDANSSISQLYGVTSLPQTYFIDSNGIVRYVVAQQLTPQTMQQGLQAIGVSAS